MLKPDFDGRVNVFVITVKLLRRCGEFNGLAQILCDILKTERHGGEKMSGRPKKKALQELMEREAIRKYDRVSYSKSLCNVAREHFSDLLRDERKYVIGVPSIKSFAELVSQPISTVKRWIETYPEFAVAMEECKELGKAVIIDAALTGKINPKMAQFVLSSEYGMADSHVQTVNGGVPAVLSEEDRDLLRKVGGKRGQD